MQGRGVDASLNNKGKEQADRVHRHFEGVHFDAIFTSELKRSKETVAPLLRNAPTVYSHEGFDEISCGKLEGVKASIEEKNEYSETVKAWRRGELEKNIGGGESPIEVMNRQMMAMQEVINHGGENMLVCMHGRAMRILLCWLLNYPLNFMDGFPHRNCCYYQLSSQNDQFSVSVFNHTKHLL